MADPVESPASPTILRAVVASSNRDVVERVRSAFGENSGVQLIGVATDGIEAAQFTSISQPDLVVLDDQLDGDGLRVCGVLNKIAPRTRVLLLVQGLNEKTILDAARAGAREVLSQTFNPSEFLSVAGRLTDAEERLIGQEYEWATNPESFPRLLVVTGAKGGVGVTSIAVNLAALLSAGNTGRTVLLDGDTRFRDSAAMLNVWPRYGLVDLGESFQDAGSLYPDKAVLQRCSATVDKLDLVVSSSAEVGGEPAPTSFVARAALALKRSYRYVITDAPISMVVEHELALPSCWRLLVVANLKDVTLLQNTRRCLAAFGDEELRAERVGLVINRDSKPSDITPKDIQDVLGINVVATIPDDFSLTRACNIGKPLVLDNPSTPAAKALSQLADKLLKAANVASTGGKFFAS